MLRVTLKGVRGHLVRFLLTAFAVTLGVALVTGTFVLRDSIDRTLGSLLSSATKGLDVAVRGTKNSTDADSVRADLPLRLADTLRSVPGVARVSPDLQGSALIAGRDGTVVRNGGAPGLGFAFHPDDPSFSLVKGRGPTNAGEVAVESATLTKSSLRVGDTTQAVIGRTARQVTVVGEVSFGSLFGATAVLVDETTARAAFAPDGTVASFSVTAAPGIGQQELRDRIAARLPAKAEAVTGAKIAEENKTDIQQGLSFFTTFLLVFAGIALFVGSFIIANTFSMLIAQRTRELALLRAVGASRGQVVRMVLGEAVVIGLVGSVAGIATGLGVAAGLEVFFRAVIGVQLSGGLPVTAFTVVVSLLVGTLVTLISSVFPAIRASRVAPVAAMRDDAVQAPRGLRRRGSVGIALVVLGAGLLTWAVTRSDPAWPAAGWGAALLAIGALVAAPLATRPVVRVVAWPFATMGGVVGRLARENALRVPRRTASTASALMIGLTLITGLSVVAESVKASVQDIVARELTADFVLSSAGATSVPAGLAEAAGRIDGVGSVAPIGLAQLKLSGVGVVASAATATGLRDNVDLHLVSGDLSALDAGQILISQTEAKDHGWHTGSTLNGTVGTLTGQAVRVGGVFKDSQLLQPVVLPRSLYQRAVPAVQQQDYQVYLRLRPGADPAAVRSELSTLIKPYLVVTVQDGAEYANSAASSVDTLLNLLYILLALSVVIAVLGIVNTLALSVFERTREVGLLRAVGLRRAQLARMITIEAIATAVFGAVLGTVLGLGLGTALQHGLRGSGLDTLAISWGTVVVLLVSSAVAGVLAAVLPAIRAVRLDVLQAIATE
jgi:putative ABC transport system permease protein